MYQLYIANKNYSSWSLRPWVLMTQLSIPFEEQMMAFSEGSNWEAFRAFSPSGQVPCLHDGEMVVWDSLAIVEYLHEHHEGVWPEDPRARAWARCAAAEMHSGFEVLRDRCPMNCGVRVRLGNVPLALEQDLLRLDELWMEGLGRFGGPFLAGRAFTAVDAFFAPVAYRVTSYGLVLSPPSLDYVALLHGLESMRSWDAAALAEEWREPGHEQDLARTGELIEDRRLSAS